MKESFGDEYPAANYQDGVRMPLVSESRWIRFYAPEDKNMRVEISRFMDGSAAITFQEFVQECPTWDGVERRGDEAFDLLERALNATELSESCNRSQGIPLTKHPRAVPLLRKHLDRFWSEPSLWDDDSFLNWIAYGATCGIEQFLSLGVNAEEFTERVRALSQHACAHNRDSCRRFLGEYYPWLREKSEAGI